jgi:hypothetical protein
VVGNVVGLDHLTPITGSGCNPAARLLDDTVRGRGLAHPDVYAGDILTLGHLYVGCIDDPDEYLAELRRLVARPELRVFVGTYTVMHLRSVMNGVTATAGSSSTAVFN